MIEKFYQMLAFEVEEINTRKNYVYLYNPYDQSVSVYETSNNLSAPKLISCERGHFPLRLNDAYEYFKYVHSLSLLIDSMPQKIFIGWVNPHTFEPIEEGNFVPNEYKTNITKQLNLVFENFLQQIQNEQIRDLLRENAYFAGGCIASLMKGEEIKDFDLFVTYEEVKEKLLQYYKNDNTESLKPILITDNAITFPNDIQIIIRECGEPNDIVSRFDFVHCMGWYFPYEDELSLHFDTIKSVEENQLIYNNRAEPSLSAMYRMTKFLSRGWKISKKEQTKIIIALQQCEVPSDENENIYYEQIEQVEEGTNETIDFFA